MSYRFVRSSILAALLFGAAVAANVIHSVSAQGVLWGWPFSNPQPQATIDFKTPPLSLQPQIGTAKVGTAIPVSNIQIGAVAYTSLGTSTAYAATTDLYCTSFFVPYDMTVTNINYLVGATAGNAAVIGYLFNAAGTNIGNSALTGTTPTSGAENTFFTLPLVSALAITGPSVYYVCLEGDSTSDTLRLVASSTYIGLVNSIVTGATFGTQVTSITIPTTFTTVQSPIAYLN